jgi:hypothetical protein
MGIIKIVAVVLYLVVCQLWKVSGMKMKASKKNFKSLQLYLPISAHINVWLKRQANVAISQPHRRLAEPKSNFRSFPQRSVNGKKMNCPLLAGVEDSSSILPIFARPIAGHFV